MNGGIYIKGGQARTIDIVILIVFAIVLISAFIFFYINGEEKDNNKEGEPYLYIEVKNYGAMKFKLDKENAPITVKNLEDLCEEDFYDGLTFHRIIQGFMIQGGDPTGTGSGGPGYTIESEADNGLVHEKGAISMAKKGGDTEMSGSQFFIVHSNFGARHLDGDHTVFGKIVVGMEVLDSIALVETDSSDRPLEDVVIIEAYVKYE